MCEIGEISIDFRPRIFSCEQSLKIFCYRSMVVTVVSWVMFINPADNSEEVHEYFWEFLAFILIKENMCTKYIYNFHRLRMFKL